MRKRLSYLLGIAFLGLSFTQAVAQKQQVIFKAEKSKAYPIEQVVNETAKSTLDTIHYDKSNDSGIGLNAAASFGAYIYIPTDTASNYEGKSIKQVMLYINEVSDVASAQIEIHHNQQNGAVYTQPFEPVDGWNTVALTTPYALSATQDFYLGYHVEATGGAPLGCDAGPTNANGNGDWMIYNGSWSHLPALNSELTYNWNIRAIVGDILPNDAALPQLNVETFNLEGTIAIEGTIANYGSNELTSIDINWQIDEGTVYTETVSSLSLGVNDTYSFSHSDSFTGTVGSYNLKVWVSNMNGTGGDEFNANDTIEKIIHVVSFFPEKKVFGEEATGTWCPWCVRGHVYMDLLAEKYPDTWIGVAVHNGDPMVNSVYDNGIGNFIGGYPSGLVDRVPGSFDPSEFEDVYLQQINEVPPADLNVTYTGWDPATRVVTFDVSSEFVIDYSNVRFNAVVAENYVTGTTSRYAQANAYAGGSYGPMGGYENLPNPVPGKDMVYMHVARRIIGGWNGTENSIPASVAAGETHSYSYEYTVPAGYNPSNMDFVGLLLDQTSGKVLNANDVTIPSQTVTFNIMDENSNAFGNAEVIINGIPYITDASGVVELQLINDDYSYIVSVEGYEPDTVNFTVNDAPASAEVVLAEIQTYTLTFNVTNGTDPIEGAKVFIFGVGDRFTDVNGTVVLTELIADDYNYQVSFTNYSTVSGTASIVDQDVTENIILNLVGISGANMIDFNVYPNPAKEQVNIELPGKFEVNVMNAVGQILSSKVIDGNGSIGLNDLKSGIYFIKITNDSQIGVKQIIVE